MQVTPAAVQQTIQTAAESRGDGNIGFILSGPKRGPYASNYTHDEIRDVYSQLKALNDSGTVGTYPKEVIYALFERGYDIIDDANPTSDAGMGRVRWRLGDLRSELIILASNLEDVSKHTKLVKKARRSQLQGPAAPKPEAPRRRAGVSLRDR